MSKSKTSSSGVELGPNFFVNSTLKFIELASNDESEPLKFFYFMSDASTCENFKVLN